jgi:hypothetical protein
MHRGLPLLVGLKSVRLRSSELWFGASDNPLVMFTRSSETSSADSWEILQVPFAEVVVSTCNARLHSRRAHETILLHNKDAIQHSFNTLLTQKPKSSKLNLDRALGGQQR